ncbi:MAG: hypothetical protein A2157_13025 [Deltaproteobacteria bacterium RBG_16_47_11]|nr:MAG: hypothetical protein A2169_03550 [Deltaproteobacteria bacterium RBG_13_47_9]OGP88402.1 MAG: hypothetical protein A2157_13025 [Deltaproteobacteria bacterium RBG_16_47_11]
MGGAGDREMDGEKILAEGNRDHWIRIIERSIRDLHDRVNMQHSVLLTILGKIKNPTSFEPCSMADCPHKKLFHRVLLETIEVLEETKRSFKSKRLEELRKRLTDLLKETA